MTVIHINGYLHELTPTQHFPNLLPDGKVEVDLSATSVIVAKTDVMPNWYVVAGGLEPRILDSTKGESLKFVGSFNSASQWKRSAQDLYDPFTPEKRYEINDIADLKRPGSLIIPTPLVLKYVSKSQRVDLGDENWNIVAHRGLDKEAQYLAGTFLKNVFHCLGTSRSSTVCIDPITFMISIVPGFCDNVHRIISSDGFFFPLALEKLKIQLIRTGRPSRKVIELKIGVIDIKDENSDSNEAYSMEVDPSKEAVKIVGKTPRGVFWGIQSFLSVVNEGKAPQVTVKDAPRYEYRGLSIDVARNFLPKKEMMRIMDGMAMFKMNKLHLHLTDDEGWRLEIPGLPQLTEVSFTGTGSADC